MQLGKKKCILRVWSLLTEQSEGNNHTSKINVSPVLHTIFFLLTGQKVDLFAPHGAIKSTLWPASRKKIYFLSKNAKKYVTPKKFFKSKSWVKLPIYIDLFIVITFSKSQHFLYLSILNFIFKFVTIPVSISNNL